MSIKKHLIRGLMAATALTISVGAIADEASVAALVKKKFPNLENVSVRAVPEKGMKGLYIVTVNGKVSYTNEQVDYIFVNGNIVDAQTAKNLTPLHQLFENQKTFTKVPRDQALKYVYGKGERVILTIEDPDCPACKAFTKNLATYPNPEKLNLTVYTYPYALDSIHPDAKDKAIKLWCSSNTAEGRAKAWKDWMVNGVFPAKTNTTCANPVQKNMQMFGAMGVNATPTVIFSDGTAIPGGFPMEKLIEALNSLDKPVGK